MEELSIDQQARVRLGRITDRGGNEAPIDGDPVWRSTDPALMSVEADPADPMVAVCVPMDNAADTTVVVECEVDADLGDGSQPLIGVITFAITGGAARFVELAVESREDKGA
jgi:hypothetical protein